MFSDHCGDKDLTDREEKKNSRCSFLKCFCFVFLHFEFQGFIFTGTGVISIEMFFNFKSSDIVNGFPVRITAG